MELLKLNKDRIKKIDLFMKRLIESTRTEEKVKVFREFEKDIEEMTPLDMFYLHNYGDKTDLSINEIKSTANKFVNVFYKGLEKYSRDFNHILLKKLFDENQKMEEHLNVLKEYYKSKDIKKYKDELLEGFKKCLEFELKFIKFENIIFPQLEHKLPSTKPFEVLWSLHDDARSQIKDLIKLLEKDLVDERLIIEKIGAYYYLVFGINQKERLIIMPLLEELHTEAELNALYNECIDYGFVFMGEQSKIKVNIPTIDENQFVYKSITGQLSQLELSLILNKIPIDITFVDKDDKVTYFNDRKERHFPRNPSVIGRLVKHCHPPKSVHIVEEIVNDFRNNRRDSAEFWIEIRGVFLYIIYYALRDQQGQYQGVLEVSQDVSHIRSLQGQKRLL
ncbi:MAG: PAS domain-containing protein [Candidatus Izemoplasmatales bacterium]